MKIKTERIILLISLFIAFTTSLTFAGTVLVKPGRFDHFVLQVPERIIAGENTIIKVMVYDAHDNIITNFAESGREFRIGVTGSAFVQPLRLGPSNFPGGVANITFMNKRAETVVLSIYEEGGTVPLISRDIVVLPNKLDHFVIQSPPMEEAGRNFDVRIIAEDAFGNPVSDTEMVGKVVRVTSRGDAALRVAGTFVPDFKKGTTTVSLISEKSGDAFVEVHETTTGSKGISKPISIVPATLSYFRVLAPKEVTAGEPFEVVVSAYDAFGNPITNYASTGNGVVLQATGTSKIEPSFHQAANFNGHVANLKVTYEKAEEINIIVKEYNKGQEGKSGPVKVNPANVDHFVVVTPESAVAGQPFKLKIEAYDRFKNIVKNYNLIGSEVLLSTSGKGNIIPSVISPAEFKDGVAFVEVVYDRAESFSISATPLRKERFEKIKTEALKVPVEEPPVSETKSETKKEPIRDRKEETPSVKETKREPAKEIVKETRPDDTAVKAKGEKIKETKKPEPKPSKETVSKLTSINNVAIIESRDKAMLVISTSHIDDISIKEDIVTKNDVQWLELRISPSTINTNRNFKFKSRFIGSVILEEDRAVQNGTIISLQLLPQKVLFDVAKVKNSIVVTISKP